MKRLWMRLGLVAGILGVGGAGVLVAQRGSTSPEEAVPVASAAEGTPAAPTQPQPIALPETESGAGYAAATAPSYSNELEIDEPGNTAQFVERPSAPEYNSSPASYSISDSDQSADASAETAPTSTYAPVGSYVGDATAEAATPTYGSRYGDINDGSESAGSTLRMPQEASQPEGGGRYGGYAAQLPESATTEDVASEAVSSVSQPTPEYGDANQNEANNIDSPTYAGAVSVVNEGPTLAAPPRLEEAVSGSTSYEPTQSRPTVGQPELLTQDTISAPPSALPSYASTVTATSNAAVVPSPLASDTPGTRELEGAQTPMLTFEKRAPSEVSVGRAAAWKTVVRNVGNVTAHGVVITDRVPQGTKLVDASPEFSQTADGSVAWQLGDLAPGDEVEVSMDLVSLVEGTVGSIAQVTFQAQASVQTISTKPELVVKHTGPAKVLIGEEVIFDIVLSNPGSGATTGIVIEEDVPVGLAHDAGDRLEYEIGTLRPKEEKQLQLKLRADKAGVVENLLRVKADGNLQASDPITLEVIAPDLRVGIAGPRTRYLDRQVTYDVAVANPGTSTAYDVQLVTFLPKGLQYISADNRGAYDPRRHAVYWSLAELPADESGTVKLTALPIETGEQKLLVEGSANLNLSAKSDHLTTVQALTELAFSVQDVHDPIEVGSETTYEIRIVNNGNKVATNVQIAAEMPEQLIPISGEGPTKVIVEGQQVFMEALTRIAPRDEAVYRITARGIAAGDHVITVQLVSDEVPTPVQKQEGTKVYADE